MKKLVFALVSVMVLSSCAWAQGSPPASPSPFRWNGNYIENVIKTTTGLQVILTNSAGKDTVNLYRLSSLAYMVGSNLSVQVREVRADSMRVNNGGGFTLGGSRFTSLLGTRMRNNGGLLEPYFNSVPLIGAEIAAQTIGKTQIDTSTALPINGYRFTALIADSANATINSAKWLIGHKVLDSSVAPVDQYAIIYDNATGKAKWSAQLSAAGGTTTKFDTSSTHSTNKVMSASTFVVAFPGASFTKYGSDTLAIQFGGSSIKTSGDSTTNASATSWIWGKSSALGSFSGLDTIRTKKVQASDSIGTPKVWTDLIQGRTNTDLSIYPYSTSKWMNLKTDTVTTGSTTARWYIAKDTITNSNAGSAVISKMATHDSVKIGGVWFSNGSFTDATHGNTGIATKKNVRDTLNADLANYVAKTAENVQRSSFTSGGGTHYQYSVTPATGDTALIIDHTLNGPDTTYIRPSNAAGLTPTLDISAAGSVNIHGPTSGSPEISLSSNTNLNGKHIRNVDSVEANSLVGATQLRLKGSTSSNYTNVLANPNTSSYSITLPSSNASGALTNDGTGTLSWTATGSGAGGYPLWINSASSGNLLDSSIWVGGSGITMTPTKNAYPTPDQVSIAVTGLQPSNFATVDSIASRKVARDTALVVNPWFQGGANGVARRVGTNPGADSVWIVDSMGVKRFEIKISHTGADTVMLLPYSGISTGSGLVVGNSGNLRLEGDSVFLPAVGASSPRKMIFGKAPNVANSGTATNFLDSLRLDSIVTQKGHYATTVSSKPMKQNCQTVSWYYPSAGMAANDLDSSIKITFSPYTPAEFSDSLFLARCSTLAGIDTTFGPMLVFPITDSVTADSLFLWLTSTSSTYANVGLDSMQFSYTAFGSPQTSTTSGINLTADWGTDRAPGTTTTAYGIKISSTQLKLGAGDVLRCRLKINLTQNNSALRVVAAQLRGTKW